MPDFEVADVAAPQRLPEAWWARVTIVEGDREEVFHVLIPDRGQAEPSADWIEAQLRSKATDNSESAIDQLSDLVKPYYGMRHPVIRLQHHGWDDETRS